MGFPVGYSELPKLFLHLLLFLAHLRELIDFAFRSIGLGSLLDSEVHGRGAGDHGHENDRLRYLQDFCSVAAELVRESLPAVQFGDLLTAEGVGEESRGLPETCAVCLSEFEGRHEVRRMSSCRHVFHTRCVDRWLEHGQRTCPLCRAEVSAGDCAATPERVVGAGADVGGAASPASLRHAATAPSRWASSSPFLLGAMET